MWPHILIHSEQRKRCAVCAKRIFWMCDTCEINGERVGFCEKDSTCYSLWLPHQVKSNFTSANTHMRQKIANVKRPECSRCENKGKTVKECSECPRQRLCQNCFDFVHRV